MSGSALVVFREVLEAALIIAVVMGATRGVLHRGRWVMGGIGLGLLGSAIVAGFAGSIASALHGRGQELFNAGVLLAAVLMLAWHNVWMSAHGRQITAQLKEVGQNVSMGTEPLSALAVVTFFAVLREGSETVLFLYSFASAGVDGFGLLAGSSLGLAGGATVGWLLYRGLLAIPVSAFMSVVSGVVLLLAAGLAASAARFLHQGGFVPALGYDVWDTSHILAQDSWLGMFLHILIGYTDTPMGIQLVFYAVTLVTILALMRVIGANERRTSQQVASGGWRA